MKVEATTIAELIERSADVCPDLAEVDRLVAAAAPELERRLFVGPSISMIGYGSMPWRRASGSGVWPLLGLAPQRHGVSLYVAARRDGVTLPERYAPSLGRADSGKHCLRLRRLSRCDVDELRRAVRDAVAWGADHDPRYGRACAAPVTDGG
ncbi:hypothetical protein [Isoptericola sp. AK164]|uniref:hypothetical protein n=1 Tax=Isoptericola sp. AK164 TaxID=3024246 RepID=UPI0024182851|nr:hypothetical protein [Isoptericola sp. AK164]